MEHFRTSKRTRGESILKGGTQFWTDEIDKAGLSGKIKPFNDVLAENEAPVGYGDPVLRDVVLDGRMCDVYHTDGEGRVSGHRIYIHIKEGR